MAAARFLAEHGLSGDAGVVGEPTELQVCTAHKGTYMRRLTFHGKAAHSASSHLGINAVSHAAQFCVLYDRLNDELKKVPHPVLGPANASVTVIQGGTRQNTIPESCSLVIDRRLLPGESSEKADRELDIAQGQLAAKNCMLNALAVLNRDLGDLDRIQSIVKMLAFVASTDDFYAQPQVANGASELLVDVFGQQVGCPSRSAIGVNVLPGNIPVEIELLIELKK